ncbi:hypothetical protein D2E26_1268 [Bifidobacterium dolichotidis]|uniref:HTH cro/C1-type domain-containing protein n=2 Tax=Bifidobacterium dolichotidis TaxID=2306976 RepID=A0A430FQY1_9BIFI|nr:hypothetical protein D2E26_1268 [Bifidobacterium dolichotidis]
METLNNDKHEAFLRGQRLKGLRIKQGLTQAQVAEHVTGVNRPRVAAYENGSYDLANMSFGTAKELAAALGLSISTLAKII